MKEVSPEKLDMTETTEKEAVKTSPKTSQAKGTKKKTVKKKAEPKEAIDPLEKVRAEEKAKLEALQNREREKTRVMVEKERARLEAELDKEIRALEAQLAQDRARSEAAKEASSERIQLVDVETKTIKPEAKEKVAAVKTKTEAPKTKVASKTAKAKTATSKAKVAGTKAKAAKKAEPKPEVAAKAASTVVETAIDTSILTPEVAPVAEVQVEAVQTETIDKVAGAQASDALELSSDVKEVEAHAKALEEAVSQEAEVHAKALEEASAQALEEALSSKLSEEMEPSIKALKTEKEEKATPKAKPKVAVDIPEKTDKVAAKEDEEAVVVDTLQKLREKIQAQKQLERELMEKEASKIQEKDRVLLDKISQFDDDATFVESEDIKAAQEKIDSLIAESKTQRRKIKELEEIINKVKSLKIDNINIINQEDFEISNDFLNMSFDMVEVNKIIKDIEKELDNLTLEHQNTIEKLRDSEIKNKRLQGLYQSQIKDLEAEKESHQSEINRLIADLVNKEQIYQEKLREEKDNSQANLAIIENLEYEKLKYESDISVLKSEIDSLNNKLQKRFDASLNAAARIDALEAQKVLLESKIIQLSKQLIMKERGLTKEIPTKEAESSGPYEHLLSEIERLKEEVKSLAYQQMPKPDTFNYSHEAHNCPYVRFFNPGMIPNASYHPTALNQDLAQEVRNLKQEFEEFKQVKPEDETEKKEEEAAEINRILEDHSQQIKEYQEELDKSKAELSLVIERNNQEINKLSESYESQIQTKDNEKNMIKAEKDRKIQDLQAKIQEKDKLLEKINEEVKRLNEDDIFDPEFKRKIRVIRDMRRESEESIEKEEQEYQKGVNSLKENINAKTMEIDLISDKIFELELAYKQNRDFSTEAQEKYEKAKSKFMIERQLQEERRHNLEDDLTRLNFKYQSTLKNKTDEIDKLNKQEADTIEFFLNKLRRSKTRSIEGLSDTQTERDELASQLENIQEEGRDNPDEIEVDMPFDKIEDHQNDNNLEDEIHELTRHYNEYYRQLTELKAEQDKRIEVEKRLRTSEKTVYDYCTSKVNMEESLKSYQEKCRLIEEKQQELSKTTDRPEDRTTQLKYKAEIQDLEVHRNDLRAKIDFYRKQISDLEKEEITQKYKALLAQLEKIRKILREKREQAEAIKDQIQAKTKELELLKG